MNGGWGVRDLVVRYGDRTALDGVTLDVRPDEVTAVVGGDGAGKTTLLRALAGAARITAGSVRRPEVRRIGYVSAGPGIYGDLTADENLAFAGGAYGLSKEEVAERSGELLARTGLTAARGRLVGRLSGGMRQKLAVAVGLLHRPDLLVLDEPTTGVDPVSRADLWRLISGAAAAGTAVVFATTYLDEAERAGEVLALEEGRPLAFGSPDEVVRNVPGFVVETDERPSDERRSWRRGDRWRRWVPDAPAEGGRTHPAGVDGPVGARGRAPDGGDAVAPDLEDAVIVAALARREAA